MTITKLVPKTRRYKFMAAFRNTCHVIVEANNEAEAKAKLERFDYQIDQTSGEWEVEYLNPASIQEIK